MVQHFLELRLHFQKVWLIDLYYLSRNTLNLDYWLLAKKALDKNPKYVNYDYRKEQLWGEKLQASTEILLQNEQLKEDVILAKSKINASS